MDIDLLARMVKEVVMDHDTVTLPGVGSFVTELVPATFADRGYTILPPYRRLYFSPTLGEDTLLVDFYAQANHIPVADADRILTDFLTEMKEVLKVKKTIVFPGLGRLRATRENHFFFVADEDLDIYPTGFGLQPISLKTHEETKEEVEEAVSALASILENDAPSMPGETTPVIPSEATPVIPSEATPAIPSEATPVIPSETTPVIPSEASVSQEEPVQESEGDTLASSSAPLGMTEPEPEPEAEPEHKGKSVVLWTLVALCVVLLLAAIALAVVGRVAPEWLDSFLYSPEELEVLYK